MKRSRAYTGLVVLAALSILFSCQPPDKEAQEKEAVFGASQVKVFKVVRQKISEKLLHTGTIEAWKKIDITPDIGGKIAHIYVQEGEKVQKGQLVAEMDTRAIRLQLQQAEAALSVADASYKDAQKNLERMDKLFQENAVSSQQHEKVKLAYEAAEAQLNQARAAVDLARYSLDVSIMRAPFSGVVASKNADVGSVINPMMGGFSSASGVLTLMDITRVKVTVEVSQKDIHRLKKGQPASVKISSLNGIEFPGTVSVVNVTADPLSKKFKIEISFENPDLALRPGTFCEVTLEVSTHENALILPQKAILENRYVFLAEGDKAVRREVTLGLENSSFVEILDGIQEGDLVIVEGNFGLEDGAPIEIQEEGAR